MDGCLALLGNDFPPYRYKPKVTRFFSINFINIVLLSRVGFVVVCQWRSLVIALAWPGRRQSKLGLAHWQECNRHLCNWLIIQYSHNQILIHTAPEQSLVQYQSTPTKLLGFPLGLISNNNNDIFTCELWSMHSHNIIKVYYLCQVPSTTVVSYSI